jgi:hypothetical protein
MKIHIDINTQLTTIQQNHQYHLSQDIENYFSEISFYLKVISIIIYIYILHLLLKFK